MLIDFEPVEQRELLGFPPRCEQQWIGIVGTKCSRHLLVPSTDICPNEIEDTLQRRDEHSCDVVLGIDALVPDMQR